MFTVGIQIIIELEREPKKKNEMFVFKPEMAAMGGDFDETMTRLAFKYFREINEFFFRRRGIHCFNAVPSPFAHRILVK